MRDLDPEFIQSALGELLRMAASINDGYGSATFLLERFGSAARNSRLHRAGTQWGQWWDSVYLCDYAAQPPFRRSVNRILVRGESVHQLERVIHAGPIRVDRGRRRDEKVMISGALTLLTNAVIAYNTWKLHQVLERSREAGQPVPNDEILAHVAPIALRHINFQAFIAFRWSVILVGFYRPQTGHAQSASLFTPPFPRSRSHVVDRAVKRSALQGFPVAAHHLAAKAKSAIYGARMRNFQQHAVAGSGHYRAATEDGRAVNSCYSFRVRFALRTDR